MYYDNWCIWLNVGMKKNSDVCQKVKFFIIKSILLLIYFLLGLFIRKQFDQFT